MTIDIDKEKHKRLKHRAIEEGKTVRELVIDAVDKILIADFELQLKNKNKLRKKRCEG
jgi:hypothetical protein